MASKKKQVKVTLTRSTNKRLAAHKATIAGLGLRRIGHTVTLIDTPEIRGMINKVAYMVAVEDA
ncbi:MAG: 50S ribosomal protein L30 [Gammaproteobacteria bacterium RIFCSPLOWO2_02_FULL_47_50]|jgi:large subunit ribosomal protein L30|nr:MAG: 50S ribosomal protein L30 [Gammaproteobacteria bacterium RIFCSPLOWO2_02_47_7]OGT64448.1 MAG: 50S ribosomal protein L30 [Gammaproteobacteria bacterium RIFCSPLOWO2_01_FULL_47_190]OGT76751.1 MAG: 50S ribosomal protein L30 [Gammaproteobacteria bacterium RIFCSPLOWO2_12_47_11]OGT80806.1 MAG: 50S ribosomal protein L30 [Gammaproteobacteria bacterium RIFCSPLOWO2_02_FULL_47_50]OGT83609.1 MAG: 50S ribosomal protein L30 [Gammaproteobacteria bacterium RIFCSPLOWO2_12_FULL_47_76]HLD09584.1 50S riboso